MSRKKKPRMEYRYYEVPEKCPVLVLQGEKWLQNYGYQIDYLHFHNLMESVSAITVRERLFWKMRNCRIMAVCLRWCRKTFRIQQTQKKTVYVPGHGCLWMWKDLLQSCIRAICAWHKS